MKNKTTKIIKILFLYISIFLIISIISAFSYIHYSLKNRPYDELYLKVTQGYKFENYPNYPNWLYKIYVENLRGNKEDLLSLYPSPITWFMSTDDDLQTKKKNIERALNKGISINIRTKNELNMTPLHGAVAMQEEEFITFLITKGADLNAKDFKGRTPLDLAKSLLEVSEKKLIEQKNDRKQWLIDEINRKKNIINFINKK